MSIWLLAAFLLAEVAMGVVLFLTDWNKLINSLFGDKPNKAQVFVDIGKGFICVEGRIVFQTEIGDVCRYRYEGKIHEFKIPASYPVRYFERGRMVYHDARGAEALPFPDSSPEQRFSEDELSALTLGWLWITTLKELKGKGILSLKTLLIAIAVIAAAGVGIWYFNNQKSETQVPPKPPIITPIPPKTALPNTPAIIITPTTPPTGGK